MEEILEEILTLHIITKPQGPTSVWKEAGCTIFFSLSLRTKIKVGGKGGIFFLKGLLRTFEE